MIRLKTVLLIICTVFGVTSFANAQNDDRFEKIEMQKVAYVTKHLHLTTSEAQRFFPIYNQYSESIRAVRSAKAKLNSGQGKQSDDLIEFDAKEVDIKKQYRTKFAEVIGAARASQFFMVEQEFREMLYKEWQSRQNR
ncbi:hypothetical protein ACFSQ3_01435 [Sphingobacterium corticis]|uniref:LTXXQ motif family protein n=1 Tax=Sphingobacterium corticis TaxID=1812823 RepID=A0ABW5NGC6_9SPHI